MVSTEKKESLPDFSLGRGILVLIPVWNEENSIAQVVHSVLDTLKGSTVLVVNDGSTDRTREEALSAGAKVINHTFNQGYGAALHTGYKYALKKGFKILVQLDGDGQHKAKDLPLLLKPVLNNNVDVAVGSRFLSLKRPSLSFSRRIGIRFFSLLAGLGSRRKITDPTSGFQALNQKALFLLAEDYFPDDYPDADVLLHLARHGCRIMEIPVTMNPRKQGQSMHSGIRTLYYIYKMSLSIAMTPLRARPRRKQA